MNYIEKVRYLEKIRQEGSYDINKYYIDIRIRSNKWQANELEEIIAPYKDIVPEEYIKFIKEFDNSGITFVTFFGSKGANGILLADEEEYFRDYLQYEYFPFAKDPAGDIYAFNKKQEVIWFWQDKHDPEEPEKIQEEDIKFIASSFVEFIEDCLIGKRYSEFVGEDECYAFYKSLGWV